MLLDLDERLARRASGASRRRCSPTRWSGPANGADGWRHCPATGSRSRSASTRSTPTSTTATEGRAATRVRSPASTSRSTSGFRRPGRGDARQPTPATPRKRARRVLRRARPRPNANGSCGGSPARAAANAGLVMSRASLLPEVCVTAEGVWWHPVAATDPAMQVSNDWRPWPQSIDAVTDEPRHTDCGATCWPARSRAPEEAPWRPRSSPSGSTVSASAGADHPAMDRCAPVAGERQLEGARGVRRSRRPLLAAVQLRPGRDRPPGRSGLRVVLRQRGIAEPGAFGWVTLVVEAGLVILGLGQLRAHRGGHRHGAEAGIGVAVANAERVVLVLRADVGLHPRDPGHRRRTARPQSARTMAAVTAVYGVAVAVAHAGAGLAGGGDRSGPCSARAARTSRASRAQRVPRLGRDRSRD